MKNYINSIIVFLFIISFSIIPKQARPQRPVIDSSQVRTSEPVIDEIIIKDGKYWKFGIAGDHKYRIRMKFISDHHQEITIEKHLFEQNKEFVFRRSSHPDGSELWPTEFVTEYNLVPNKWYFLISGVFKNTPPNPNEAWHDLLPTTFEKYNGGNSIRVIFEGFTGSKVEVCVEQII